ncbi:mandelate racemase/muconate lactonizing enzyme family protein [Limnohabitans sp. Rim8]|jgi:D-galactarolactone cycloisomerase|uniref:mandelate racemase/muconate lactonizing enzyme family protein n=1 Tax=Limnohabitans sp. Rim8 TaxID=1100718 RepID=UPI0025FD3EBC|nr:mandelate racemase/muconate lactonizing enzyme family protein [Limnohabitans sp. Rim8]
MKIIDIKIHVLKSPLAEPFAFSQGWVRQRSATLVEVLTEEGITGWGEAFAQGLEPPEIAAAAVQYALKPLILGANALDTEVLWHKMYHATRDFGRKGSVIAAISAVDIALWDIAGKTHHVPIHVLLGGAFRHRVQPYATGFYRVNGQGESARLADEAIRHLDAGFTAMKVKLGYGVEDDIQCMKAIAEAVEGRGITLMVDTNHAYGRAQALRLGRALDGYNLRWYEEPVVPEDLHGYAEMRNKLTMPIAGGENEHTLFGYRDLFAANAVDIAQPDLCSCGGISAARHIVTLAQAHGVAVNPHVWGSAVAQAASLQLIAALPVAHHSLFAQEPLLEYDCSSHPFRQHLITQPIQQSGGWVPIPEGPGLGIEIDRSIVERYRVAG